METTWLGMLLLLAASGANMPTDLVSLIDAEAYFQSRKIEVTAVQLAALAGKEPTDGKAQISQLLALRWLGEHGDAVKGDPKTRALLEAIAQGKQAQDPHGFARDYGKRALARLEGKAPPAMPLAENSLRDGVAWFPSDVAFVGGVDNRGPPLGAGIDQKTLMAAFNEAMPAREREKLYNFADEVGNLEAWRATFAFTVDPNDKHYNRIYIRFTGRGDRRRLADFFTRVLAGATVKDEKGPKGEPVTVLTPATNGPAIALIGDTELIMAGYDRPAEHPKQAEVVREVLNVWAGRLAGVGKGAWEARLKEIPAKARALYAGEVPDEMRKELTSGTPFKDLPSHVVAYVAQEKDVVARFRGTFGSAADAKAFCEAADQVKQMGLMALKNPMSNIHIKPKGIEALSKTLESIKIEPKETAAVGELRVPGDRLAALAGVMVDLRKSFADEMQGKPVGGKGAP